MAETTVKVGGDSREAVRELEQLGRAAAGVGMSLKSMAAQAALTGLAVVGLDNVVAVIQRTIEVASESMAAYVEQNEAAARESRALSQATADFKVELGEAMLGGDNAALIFGNLRDIMLELTGALAANQEGAQRFGLSLTSGVLRTGAFASMMVEEMIVRFHELRLTFADIGGAWNELVVEFEQGVNIVQAALTFGDVDAAVATATDAMNAAREAHRRSVRAIEEDIEATRATLGAAARAILNNASDIENGIAAVSQAADMDIDVSISGGAGAGGAADTAEDAKRAAQMEADRLADLEERKLVILQDYRARKKEQEDEYNAMMLERAEMHAQKLMEIAQREADEQAALLQQRQDRAREAASSIGGLIAELAGGQRKALDVIKQFIGQELIAKGQSFLLEAAAMAFKPGMQVMAAGLAAASVGMIAAGAKLSKSGGGARSTSAASAGTAPLPQAAGQAERRSTEVNVSFGVVGDPRRAAGMVADMVREANRDGYTAGAA